MSDPGLTCQESLESGFGDPEVTFTDGYGAAGDLLSRAETINGAAGATTSYSYDGLHRVTSERQTGGVAAKRADFAYDELGQMTQASRYADASGTTLVASSAYGYDGANRLTSVSHTKGATTLASYALAYDAANRVTTKASAADGTTAFQYDSAGQLTQSSGPGPAQSYGYDAAGNRSGAGYATGAYNRVLSDGRYSYEYDAEGNRTKRTNLATGATDEYTWDYRDRLTRVLSKTSGGAVTKDVRYAYDAEDDRVRKEVDGDGDGTYEATENYAYAGGQLALVLDTTGAVQERYLYGPGVDQPLAVERGGSVKWLLADDQGTVRDVLDATGAVADHLAVDAFGVVVSQTNAAAQPRFVYTGRELDLESGLYQYRARYYDAAAGRFLSEDPSGFAAGDANLYRYAGNSAPNLTDPSGLRPQTPLEGELTSLGGVHFVVSGDQVRFASLEEVYADYLRATGQDASWQPTWYGRGGLPDAPGLPSFEELVALRQRGWLFVPGTIENLIITSGYQEHGFDLWDTPWASGLPLEGDDWVYEAARQYEQYRRDFFDISGRLQGALAEAAAGGLAGLDSAADFAVRVVHGTLEPVYMGVDVVQAGVFLVGTELGYQMPVPVWVSEHARGLPMDKSQQLEYLLWKQGENVLYTGGFGLAGIGAGKLIKAFAQAEAGGARAAAAASQTQGRYIAPQGGGNPFAGGVPPNLRPIAAAKGSTSDFVKYASADQLLC